MLPKGKYVLFGRWDDDSCHLQTYGIFEREEYCLEATCDRDKMYRCISVNDNKEVLEITLRELNMLNSELKEAEDEVKNLRQKAEDEVKNLKHNKWWMEKEILRLKNIIHRDICDMCC